MKRRMICILLCAVLLCGLLPCAAAAGTDVLTLISCENGRLTVGLGASVSTLVACSYQDGRLSGSAVKQNCAPGSYSFTLPDCYQYKVFALDGSGIPVCEALEVKDASSVLRREETDVPLPTLDDSVAIALGAAVSEYARFSLTMLEIQSLFADEEAFAALENDAALLQQVHGMLFEAMDSLQDVMPALTALDAVTQKQIDEITEEIALQSVSLQSADEVMTWAEELTKQFDALEGNNRVQQLAKNMGCDVKTAYNALTAAQEVLFQGYNADADCYQNWENAMIAVKATSKVAFFVCATAATAGAASIAAVPAALTTGTVSVAGAAGILAGTVDVSIELGVDTAKLVLGNSSPIVEKVEDTLKPVTDGLLLFSLCTLNTANGAEKLAFLGDLGQRAKELYDSITVKSDENGNLKADITRLDRSDPDAAAEILREKELPSPEDAPEGTMEAEVEQFRDAHEKSEAELTELLRDEGIIKNDAEFTELLIDYNETVVNEYHHIYENHPNYARIVESYDSTTGELSGITCYDAKGNRKWSRYYTEGRVHCDVTCEWDENGDLLEVWNHYAQDPLTGFFTTQLDWIDRYRYVGGIRTREEKLETLDYNPNGTVAQHWYKDLAGNTHDEQYDGSGVMSTNTIRYPDRTYQASYYTYNDPNVPGVNRVGHLQFIHEYPKIPENEMFVYVYTIREEWTAVKRYNYTDKLIEYGWNHSVWNGSYMEGRFELVYSEPMPEN